MIKKMLMSLMLLSGVVSPAWAEDAPASMMEQTRSLFQEGRGLLAEMLKSELPENCWFFVPESLCRSSESYRRSMEKLLQPSWPVFARSELVRRRTDIGRMQARIQELQHKVERDTDELPTHEPQRVIDSKGLIYRQLHRSRESFAAEIRANRNEIESLQHSIEEAMVPIQSKLLELGVKVDDRQLAYLIHTPMGEQDINFLAIINGIKNSLAVESEFYRRKNVDSSLAYNYYADYVLFSRVMTGYAKHSIRKIEDYQDKLNELMKRARARARRAEQLGAGVLDRDLRESADNVRELSLANAKLEDQFARILETAKTRLKKYLGPLEKRTQIAELALQNAIDTKDFRKIMEQSKDFDEFMKIEIPSLIKFDNSQVARDFEIISSQLR